jgi:TatD DNase family protein
MIDTHAHLDGEEFSADITEVISRAKDAGVQKVFIPATDYNSCINVLNVCREYEGFLFPMLGLHPEEVKADYKDELEKIKSLIDDEIRQNSNLAAIGEVGLDYYWSREYETEQLDAFRIQVEWSIEKGLPLMIHCRKGQNEMVHLLNQYKRQLKGGIFHCFTGNSQEAEQLLQFDNFVLGIGGVLTFKKSHLPEVLAEAVPLNRIVLETDSPYMAPVPMRGKRNESSFVKYVLKKLSEVYNKSEEEINHITTLNALRIVNI